RAPARTLHVARDCPDPGGDREDAQDQRDRDRAHRDRRQREVGAEDAEDDPGDRDVLRADPLRPVLGLLGRHGCCGHESAFSFLRMLSFLRPLQIESTSRSAPTNSTTSPWMMRVRFPASCGSKTLGSSCRLDVPTVSAPKSSAAKKTPTAE